MKRYLTIPICVALFLGVLLLSGCQAASETPEAVAETTMVEPESQEPTEIPDTVSPPTDANTANISDPSDEGDEMAENTPEENYCIDCHTDQQALIDTAKPEEEVVSENEGEG